MPLVGPAGGQGLLLQCPQGRRLQVVHGDLRHADPTVQRDLDQPDEDA